jgi:hypothetical protein
MVGANCCAGRSVKAMHVTLRTTSDSTDKVVEDLLHEGVARRLSQASAELSHLEANPQRSENL